MKDPTNTSPEINTKELEALRAALDSPPANAVTASRHQVKKWFETAPLIEWDVITSPLGALYLAANTHGLCSLNFGVSQAEFIGQLDPLARTRRNPSALAPFTAQLRAYFSGERRQFDLALDLRRLTPFQRKVLQTARRIPAGATWTYGQIAQAIGRPRASRAVGQALGRNPVPIVVPCHRVVTSRGGLGGYSGGGGLESKRFLLALEGAL
jgi:methylated-DNA-[protein]-cysteine S-methyltransferase